MLSSTCYTCAYRRPAPLSGIHPALHARLSAEQRAEKPCGRYAALHATLSNEVVSTAAGPSLVTNGLFCWPEHPNHEMRRCIAQVFLIGDDGAHCYVAADASPVEARGHVSEGV